MTGPRLDVDFSDEAAIQDPFPLYEEIRAAGRVVWNDAMQAWMLPGFDDSMTVLKDSMGRTFGAIGARHPEATFWFEAPNMIVADGSEHRRLRHALAKYFTPGSVRAWEPRVREVVDELLEPLAQGRADIDLIADFTMIPIVIVAEMLGVPPERHEDFRDWSNTVTGNVLYGHERPEIRQMMDEALVGLNAYLDVEIERHRREDLDDVLSIMVRQTDWSEAEIRSGAVNLLLAGYDTTAKLMSICLEVLEAHPDQRALLVDEPALIPNAIEEVLRYVGVAQFAGRVVAQDTELAGTALQDGQFVYTLLGAANRDPARWEEPSRFDVRRPAQTHLGFGAGPHLCIGAHLARLETQVALEALLRIAPEYRLQDLRYGRSFLIRGPEAGRIEIGQRTAMEDLHGSA